MALAPQIPEIGDADSLSRSLNTGDSRALIDSATPPGAQMRLAKINDDPRPDPDRKVVLDAMSRCVSEFCRNFGR